MWKSFMKVQLTHLLQYQVFNETQQFNIHFFIYTVHTHIKVGFYNNKSF